ncbi:MAG: pilus assembly protein [Chloroflexi bacterium]|nr:pilus assembly protein [Chloroflexota bacterium]
MFRSRKKLGNQGQAVVEFALIIIVLLLIIFFIVEASRIFMGLGHGTKRRSHRSQIRHHRAGRSLLSGGHPTL